MVPSVSLFSLCFTLLFIPALSIYSPPLSSCFPPLSLLSLSLSPPVLSHSSLPLGLLSYSASLPLFLPINAQESVLTTWCSTVTNTLHTDIHGARTTGPHAWRMVKDGRLEISLWMCSFSTPPFTLSSFQCFTFQIPGFTFITVSLQSAQTH